MNILLLGTGGREHALAWKIKQSLLCISLYIAPGNAGTAQCGTNLNVLVTDFEAIKAACVDYKIDLLVVGPEEPLVNGIVDFFRKDNTLKDVLIIGPSAAAAQLEGSKAFAKEFMQRHNIPTAAYREFTAQNYTEGITYIEQHSWPVVLKADGLAAGKGVVICENSAEAITEFESMIRHSKFGEAGKQVVVEEFLTGIELSAFILTDGKNYVLLPEAKDYKRIGERDTGPNTGGMGAISPVPFADASFMQKVITDIIEPTVQGLQKDGLDYKGFIFFGLIKVGGEPYVIEYNCRLGDPETEVVIPRIKNDLVELLVATATQKLQGISIQQDERFATTIVAVSGGYPAGYKKGFSIEGLNHSIQDTYIFHMGTKELDGKVVTNGGRVVCATALSKNLADALTKSSGIIHAIDFEAKHFRKDIGFEFL